MAVEKADDLGDVLGLIADALHVRDHLERRGDLAQVARDRLLPKQQLEAEVFDVALLPVDLAVERRDLAARLLSFSVSARLASAMTSSHSAPISIIS